MIRPPTAREVPALQRIERAAGRAFAAIGLPEVATGEPPPLAHLEAFRDAPWNAPHYARLGVVELHVLGPELCAPARPGAEVLEWLTKRRFRRARPPSP